MTTNHQRDNAQLKLENALRVWANGDNSYVAGVELLIKHGRAIHPNAPWIRTV